MSHNPISVASAQELKKQLANKMNSLPKANAGRIEMTFALMDWQVLKLTNWEVTHKCSLTETGAIGGATTIQFTNTNLGQVQKGVCACGDEIDLTDYNDW